MVAKIKTHNRSTNYHTKPKNVSLKAFERTYWPYLPIGLIVFLGIAFISAGRLHQVAHQPYAAVIIIAAAILSVV